MELTPLRYFRAIAACGHMTRAAAQLGVTQPALSSMLKKLEREVGAELLHRTGKGVELTEAGRAFLTHAEESVRAAEAGRRAVKELLGLERGTIGVGGGATAITYLLPPVVRDVRRRFPGLKFYIREAGSSAVASAVAQGELDLGIVTLPVTAPGNEALERIPLVEDELLLIVPRGHALDGQTVRKRIAKDKRSDVGFRWRDIAGEPFVAFEAGTVVRDLVDRAAARAGVALNVVMELRSIEGIQHMVAAGIGVGLVSRFALSDGQGLPCRDAKLTRRLAVVRRRDRPTSTAADEFCRVLTKSIHA